MFKLTTNLAYEDWEFADCVTESQNSDISWHTQGTLMCVQAHTTSTELAHPQHLPLLSIP